MKAWLSFLEGGAGIPAAYEAGETVFASDETIDSAWVLTKGVVEILHRLEDGRTLVIKLLVAPTFFGCIESLGGVPTALESVRCLTEVEGRRMPRAAFLQVLEREPGLAFEVLMDMSATFALTAQAEPGRVAVLDAHLANLLLAYVELFGTELGQGHHRIELRRTQTELADAVGGSERQVRRLLKAWTDNGLLEKQDGRFVVTDVQRLREHAGQLAGSLVHRYPSR